MIITKGRYLVRFLLLLCITASIYAKGISPEQLSTLQSVRDTAKKIPDYKGITYENTLSAICLTESSAGVHLLGDMKKGKSITNASLGPMQIKVQTAKYIAKLTPSLKYLLKYTDEKIATILLTDITTSVKIAAHYLVRLKKSRKKYYYMVSGYNGGWRNKPYYSRVMKNYRTVSMLVKKGHLN
jgi:hypothetical protein